jgi:ribosomal protein L6P/L9E
MPRFFFFFKNQKNKTLVDSYTSNFLSWLRFINKKIKRKLFLKGLGFRCFFSDDKTKLFFKIGYSHLKVLEISKKDCFITVEKNILIVESFNSLKLGNFCNKIKKLRAVNVYKNKGFYYSNEFIKTKQIKKN